MSDTTLNTLVSSANFNKLLHTESSMSFIEKYQKIEVEYMQIDTRVLGQVYPLYVGNIWASFDKTVTLTDTCGRILELKVVKCFAH